MKKETFHAYWYVGDPKRYEYVPVSGYEFAIEGVPFRFFMCRHEHRRGWDVCEMSTGHSVLKTSDYCKNKADAIVIASANIQDRGIVRLTECVEIALGKGGESPSTKREGDNDEGACGD
jgi:hypothetical protein